MNLTSNIFRVVFSNLIMLGSNIILSLILPMIISVKSYGEYRLYLFYLAYIGILHFGFIDAMYLKYGGENDSSIDKNILKKEKRLFTFYQSLVFLILLIGAILSKNILFILLALSILPINLGAFHKLFYQATGQFKKYSNINIIFTIINLLTICILILLNIKGAIPYIISTLIAYIIILFVMETDFKSYSKGHTAIGDVSIVNYNRVGIFILIGNICVLLITSIGGWIVQLFFVIEDFAYYSFAISMMNMILLIINAVGLTFYNFIAKKEDEVILLFVKKILLMLGALSGSMYFLIEYLIGNLLPKYELSLTLIAFSFISFPYMMVINVIVTNLYKARKLEKRYLKVVSLVLLFEVLLAIATVIIFKSLLTIIIVTLITFIVWYIFSVFIEFKYLKSKMTEVIYLLIHALTFMVTVHYLNWYIGFVTYTFVIILFSVSIFRKEFRDTLNLFKIKRRRNE